MKKLSLVGAVTGAIVLGGCGLIADVPAVLPITEDASGDANSLPVSDAGIDATTADGAATVADAGVDGGGGDDVPDAGVDAEHGDGSQAAVDGGGEAGADSGSNDATVLEGGSDAGVDAGYEGSVDSGVDAGHDAAVPVDAGADTAPVTGSEAGADSGSNDATVLEGGSDTGFDAGDDSGVDSGVDASHDAAVPVDAGADTAPVTVCIGREGLSCDLVGGSCVSGICVDPMSCRATGAGMTNCGVSGTDNCCTSLEVDGGVEPYDRSYPDNGNGETLGDPATVSSFRLDKYLVTVGRFRQFVNAWNNGAWTPAAGSGKHTYLYGGSGLIVGGGGTPAVYEPGWSAADDSNIAPTGANLACGGGLGASGTESTWTVDVGAQENLPINCVEWAEAYAFCIWDGAFLPSEAEWEYAAAGGTQQLEYPWGDAGGATPTSQYAIYSHNYPSPLTGAVQYIAPVGTATLGVGTWGQLDMAGEVFEWNLDWYAGYASPCTNCVNTTTGSTRVLRGSSFNLGASGLFPPFRDDGTPTYRVNFVGFRCARSP